MSSYSEGQTHQVMEALERAGYTADDITKFGQYPKLGDFRAVVRGHATVIIVNRVLRLTRRNLAADIEKFLGRGAELEEGKGTATTNLDLNTLLLTPTPLEEGEDFITGEKRRERLTKVIPTSLGALEFFSLMENEHLLPEQWKERDAEGKVRYFTFDRDVAVSSDGHRYVLCVYWNDGAWNWLYYWLDNEFGADGVSLGLPAN